MTNNRNTVLYVGMTSNLVRRVESHKDKIVKGFTKRYNIDKLVYFEESNDRWGAITREKQIKAGSRAKKEKMINKMNPGWRDLCHIFY